MRMVWGSALIGAAAALMSLGSALAAPEPAAHDYVIKDFRFRTGERLPELKIHYYTLGAPRTDAAGKVTNAVLILHGTGGTGRQFLSPQFADVLFAPGGLLDPATHYIILPDGIGHGGSSKPSDGLRAKFPAYDYADMVEAQHELVTKGLKVEKLRLLMGTSMGCMHGFMWAEAWPQASQALMPLACLPVEIAGRNRLWRKMAIDAVTADPAWKGGDYTAQPTQGVRTAQDLLMVVGASPLPMQNQLPTRQAVDDWLATELPRRMGPVDANDMIYQLDASRTYDPSKGLEAITAPMTWVNSADDFINPPELGIAEREARRLKTTRFVLIPASDKTRGHGTHTWAALWKDELAALLKRSEP
ncbi:MAG: alpha/beta fold hydrolase [Alphaproteobacteria bacterium]|nr:alpha/beta fold hydrolase [Alphaproteobacteria bacterium]MBU1515438.1 alpha/beta fold hydrolase [Alphaproteobacteria bacterium]MBU2095436.1 alpha/beta fold hydrolase [Alphaproteobacteria bacterium]MBU2150678.1 alpha/beta fold hydrolase [Alphaproteobacteria bacterium]MBU2306942.1 alpha/beta fold hydrolase [Alphaproteobacteria bacterium]